MKKIFRKKIFAFFLSALLVLALSLPVFADMGPKPSVTLKLYYTPGQRYAVTLLGNTRVSGPWGSADQYRERMGSRETWEAFRMYGDNVIEKHGINRDSTGDREKTRYLCGKQGIFTRDRALIRPGFIRQLETRASTRSASFFHALGSPGRPHNGGGEAGAYRTRNGAKPLKQGHLRAKRGPLGPSRKSQQQTKRTGFAAHGHSIAETAPEGKRASCANGALIRA